jgi:hypothetical protein
MREAQAAIAAKGALVFVRSKGLAGEAMVQECQSGANPESRCQEVKYYDLTEPAGALIYH